MAVAQRRLRGVLQALAFSAWQVDALSIGVVGGATADPLNATTPTSVVEVFNRFRTTQAQIDSLTKQAIDLQEEVNEVKAIAQKTAAGVVQAEKDMEAVKTAATANTATRMSLQMESKNFHAAVDLGLKQVMEMQKMLRTLETAANEMGTDGKAVAQKVQKLDMRVEELLPGVGGIGDRIKTIEATAKKYSAEADLALDKQIATNVRDTFKRETARVTKLADQEIMADTEDPTDPC
eukprot:TRINITY_DN82118_c0_g1_i1.p1 TRINITY_DN82118_c0_g1~~TRINITY_DN82118_c0_g1_i1.p1  ORF type:complete len:236 (-),score=91.95 TRINITY_DN82118_c0_g1_i1:114-821(-)